MNFKDAWDKFHRMPRYRPKYPDDRVVAWTFRTFGAERPRSLLDIGCGAGRHSLFFSSEGFRAFACDFSAVGVEETRARAAERQLHVETAVCEADELPYPDDSFDGVLV